MFVWAEGTTVAQQEEVAAKLAELPGQIPQIAAYSTGIDAGVNPNTWDFVVVADFADRDAYLVYRDHPAHRDVIDAYITPIAAQRASVQYDT